MLPHMNIVGGGVFGKQFFNMWLIFSPFISSNYVPSKRWSSIGLNTSRISCSNGPLMSGLFLMFWKLLPFLGWLPSSIHFWKKKNELRNHLKKGLLANLVPLPEWPNSIQWSHSRPVWGAFTVWTGVFTGSCILAKTSKYYKYHSR